MRAQAEVVRAQLAAGLEEIAAIKAALNDLTTTVSVHTTSLTDLSTTVGELKPVATSGKFGDLTDRPSAVKAIETVTKLEFDPDWGWMPTHIIWNNCIDGADTEDTLLGSADGRFCALSKYRYTPRP